MSEDEAAELMQEMKEDGWLDVGRTYGGPGPGRVAAHAPSGPNPEDAYAFGSLAEYHRWKQRKLNQEAP